jgi:DNA-binding CsgD family transcriptional regulator
MKKIILVIYNNASAKNKSDIGLLCQDECKLIMIDTETEEGDVEFPIITLRTDSYNHLDPDILSEFLCPQNQVYVLLAGSDGLLPIQKMFLNKTGALRNEPFAVKYSLSQQEKTVMDYLIRGLPNIVIANKLFISCNTVKNHLSNIYVKLDVKNRSAAVCKYFNHEYGLN